MTYTTREDGRTYCDECGGRLTACDRYSGHEDGCSARARIDAHIAEIIAAPRQPPFVIPPPGGAIPIEAR